MLIAENHFESLTFLVGCVKVGQKGEKYDSHCFSISAQMRGEPVQRHFLSCLVAANFVKGVATTMTHICEVSVFEGRLLVCHLFFK